MKKNGKSEPYSFRHVVDGKYLRLGKVVSVSAGRAYVVWIDHWGNILEDETTIIQPECCRALRVTARRGIEFAPARYEVSAFDIKAGGRVVYMPSSDPNYARVWCLLEHYAWALDLYDEEYNPRVLELEGRMPPQPVIVPKWCKITTEAQLEVDQLIDRV
jgi:hypothetical protein